MRKTLIFSILLAAFLARPMLAQPNNLGFEAYKAGDYQTALREWTALALEGNTDAQFNIANMYRAGTGVQKDGEEAIRWYRMAAQQGDAQAQYNMALMYNLGDGVPENFVQAFIWYSMSEINGAPNAELRRKQMQAEMTQDDISMAMQMAVACLHSEYQNCG